MGSLVTALQKIQSQFGYLKREALEQYSEQTGVPLYRLHSVASFFPHFQLTTLVRRLRIRRAVWSNRKKA